MAVKRAKRADGYKDWGCRCRLKAGRDDISVPAFFGELIGIKESILFCIDLK